MGKDNPQIIPSLVIHKLSQAQYDRERDAGRLDPNAIYLTPEEDIVLETEISKNSTDQQIPSAKAVYNSETRSKEYAAQAVSEVANDLGKQISEVADDLGKQISESTQAANTKFDEIDSQLANVYTKSETDEDISELNTNLNALETELDQHKNAVEAEHTNIKAGFANADSALQSAFETADAQIKIDYEAADASILSEAKKYTDEQSKIITPDNLSVYTKEQTDALLKTINDTLAKKANLDEQNRVVSNELPSYVDDVLEYTSLNDFPVSGETGKIYIDLTDNLAYRWGGSGYAVISPSLALGETNTTAYRGDLGKAAYAHSQITSGNPHKVSLSELGVNVKATEINYLNGATKNIPTAITNLETKTNSNATAIAQTKLDYADADSALKTEINSNLNNKVDKVSGKGLSTNDYTTEEKNKLAGIAEGADAVTFTQSLTSGTKVGVLNINGTNYTLYAPTDTNTTYSVVSTSADGLAPKRDGSTSKYLRADGTWATPPDSNTVTTVETSGSGNAITSISATNGKVTATKGSTFLTAHPKITKSPDDATAVNPPATGSFTVIDSITRDGNGHVTKINTKTVTLPFDYNTDTSVTCGPRTSGTKIYLTGAVGAVNGQLSYDSKIYLDTTDGRLAATSFKIGEGCNLVYDSTNKCVSFQFI